MFGHDWQPAAGTVVDIRVKHPNSENDSRSWLMEVRCGDAEPFRVELGYPGFHEDFKGPGLGETVQVKADLKRKDAKWDLSDPALSWKADRSRQEAEFKAEKERPVLKGARGGPATTSAPGTGCPRPPGSQALPPDVGATKAYQISIGMILRDLIMIHDVRRGRPCSARVFR